MSAEGYDMVSDLNGTDTTIPAETGDAAHGADAVAVNNRNPTLEPTAQPKKVDDTPKPVAEKPASIRDLISSALKDGTETPEGAQQDGGRRRNPDGTFAPAATEETITTADTPPAPVTAAPVGIDPTVFASLPAETQAQLARTMEDVTTQQKRFATLAPIEQLITPRIDAWAINGMAPAQALHQLLALSDFAGRDPGGFIKYMAQTNNVDLEELVLGMVDAEPVDPKVAALEKQIAELQGVTNGFTQQQKQAAHNAVVDKVLAFADEKGADGNVLRPHLTELGTSWLPHIDVVKTQNPQWSHDQVLQQAYENACWANPVVRSKMQAATTAAADAERLRKDAEKVAAARTASASVPPGSPSSPPAAPDAVGKSTREVIKAAMAQHS